MNMREAVELDKIGMAVGYTNDGLIRAEVLGPSCYLSARKKTKAWRNQKFSIYTPPKRPDKVHTGSQVRRAKFQEINKKTQSELMRLDWRPHEPRDVVSRLADLL